MEPRAKYDAGIALMPSTAIEAEASTFRMTGEKIQLLKDTFCKGATDAELELALALIQRTQLDPFARQIAFIKRWDGKLQREVMTPQVTIDGARLLAQRTGRYGGQLGPWWCGPDGEWRDVWLKSDAPAAAKVGVIRVGWAEPLYAVARFDAYAARNKDGRPVALWGSMPDVMIAKVAESLALRRAFPAELSGVYSDDEMAQASNAASHEAAAPTRRADPPRPPRQRAANDSEPERGAAMVGWSEFWPWAKSKGIQNEDDVIALTGSGTKNNTPQEVRERVEAAMEEMSRAVAARENGEIEDGEFVDVAAFDVPAADRTPAAFR